jgi:hypothetical protein
MVGLRVLQLMELSTLVEVVLVKKVQLRARLVAPEVLAL